MGVETSRRAHGPVTVQPPRIRLVTESHDPLSDTLQRRRADAVALAEREVFQRLTHNAPLPEVLEAIALLVEFVCPDATGSVSVLEEDGKNTAYIVAPRMTEPERLHAMRSGLRGAWTMPIKDSGGKVLGMLAVSGIELRTPSAEETQGIEHATQLAGLAIERRLAEEAIFAEKERAQVTLQSIGDAVISTDAQGCIDYLNPVASQLTGWSVEEARRRPIGEVLKLIHEMTRETVPNPLLGVLGRGEPPTPSDQTVLVTRGGQEIAIQESASPIRDRQGQIIGAVIVFHDVTKERRLKRALSYQASHDALTGLINRREFDNRLHAAVAAAQRGEGSRALLYIDLDQFKVVNDTCGHQAGDRLLRDITGLLQTRVRVSDTIARLGGDEFGVLLDDCSIEQATRIADGIRQAIRDYRFEWGANTMSVGASVGVVEIKPSTENVASIMTAADIACYTAKDGGRNRVYVYDASGVSARHREMHWVAQVARAVEENRLELFFQPIVAINGEAPRNFYELTVQLREEGGRLVRPIEFIPAAERYNVMSIIDQWVVSRAAELLREWHERGSTLPFLAVNISGTSLNDQSFTGHVMESVGHAPIANALCFEVTETAAVTNLKDAIHFMRELKARGCQFSLDDFGSGLSSFMYLKTLPVDFLKIDGQFIAEIASDPIDRSMVEAISKVGKALGIATVAECVETVEVLEELKRIGVDYAQGHYLARPRPIAELR
jgi:diguanylate cyclase (GGDEF)-like protein/PAS domain S-box-containing protein